MEKLHERDLRGIQRRIDELKESFPGAKWAYVGDKTYEGHVPKSSVVVRVQFDVETTGKYGEVIQKGTKLTITGKATVNGGKSELAYLEQCFEDLIGHLQSVEQVNYKCVLCGVRFEAKDAGNRAVCKDCQVPGGAKL